MVGAEEKPEEELYDLACVRGFGEKISRRCGSCYGALLLQWSSAIGCGRASKLYAD